MNLSSILPGSDDRLVQALNLVSLGLADRAVWNPLIADFQQAIQRKIMKNIFASIPDAFEEELLDDLLKSGNIRIERILSKGQSSPAQGWYDQSEHEWVVVLEGSGIIVQISIN